MSNRCGRCKWRRASGDTGECHRYAPKRTHGVGTGESSEMWPITTSESMCGDWECKPMGVPSALVNIIVIAIVFITMLVSSIMS